MAILLKCPKGHRREVGNECAGTKVSCLECGHLWKVPERKDALHNSMFASKAMPPPIVKCAWCFSPKIDPTRSKKCPACESDIGTDPPIVDESEIRLTKELVAARRAGLASTNRVGGAMIFAIGAMVALGGAAGGVGNPNAVLGIAIGVCIAVLGGWIFQAEPSIQWAQRLAKDDAENARSNANTRARALLGVLEVLRAFHIADEEYRAALDALERDPTSARLRVDALERGRAAAERGRLAHNGHPAVTFYDEAAIANDIAARTGGSVSIASAK